MEISVKQPELKFLVGDLSDATDIPIRVIRAARLRIQTIGAMTLPSHMKNWKSLDYRPADDEDSSQGSVTVVDGWRLSLKSDLDKVPPTIIVLNLWRPSNAA